MRHTPWLLAGLITLGLGFGLAGGCGYQPINQDIWIHPTVKRSTPRPAKPTAKPTVRPSVAPTPSPVQAVSLRFAATYRGAAVAGWSVAVYDARTGRRLEAGSAVKSADAATGTNGAFRLQLSTLPSGQAVRVVVSQGERALETIVTANSPTDAVFTLDEVSTATVRMASGVMAATQVLTPSTAQRVVAEWAEFQAFRPALAKALPSVSGLEADVTATGDRQASGVRVLVAQAGLLEEVARLQAEAIQETCLLAQTPANRSVAYQDPVVVAGLTDLELTGSVLTTTYDAQAVTFYVKNTVTGKQVDVVKTSLDQVLSRLHR